MQLNTEELNHLVGIINRALEEGMVITVSEQADHKESNTEQDEDLLVQSRDRLAILAALKEAGAPLMVFHNNIGRNWIGTYSVVDMYMGANGKFVNSYSWEAYGIAGGERRMKIVVGETK